MFPLRNSAAIISKRMSLHHTCYMRVDKEWYRVVGMRNWKSKLIIFLNEHKLVGATDSLTRSSEAPPSPQHPNSTDLSLSWIVQ